MAIVLATVLPGGDQGAEIYRKEKTLDKMDVIEDALIGFKAAYQRLPCPADGSLAFDDANFGLEAQNNGECTGGTPAANFSDGLTDVVAGVVPTKALQLPDEYMLDAFGRRFTYVVDKRATKASTCVGIENGDIEIDDGSGNITNAVVAIISHGKNGHGAFPSQGSSVANRLNVAPATASYADERENASVDTAFAVVFNNDFVKKEPTTGYDDMLTSQEDCCTGLQCTNIPYSGPELIVAHATTPYITLYEPGGAPDTFAKLADPGTTPTGDAEDVSFSGGNLYLAVAHASSPYVTIYKRDSSNNMIKLADPASLPAGDAKAVAFSNNMFYLAVGHATSPYITIYKRAGDQFTKLADPASLPAGTVNGVSFSGDDIYLAAAHDGSPYVSIYKRNNDTFTLLSSPAIGDRPAGNGTDAAFSPNSDYLAISHQTTPYITIYKRTVDDFTKLADPAFLPAGTAYGVAFSHDTGYLAVAHATTPYMIVYQRSDDTFGKISDPVSGELVANTGRGAAFSYNSAYLAIAHDSAPYVTIYKLTQSTNTLSKIADPGTTPTGNGNGVTFRK